MHRKFAPLILTLGLIAGQAVAQQPTDKKLQAIDDMVICGIVYGTTSGLYAEKGSDEKAESFMRTTTAYAAVADRLAIEHFGPELGMPYIDERMKVLLNSLNATSEKSPNGDLDVIDEWLGYCDNMGPWVQKIVEKMQAEFDAQMKAAGL